MNENIKTALEQSKVIVIVRGLYGNDLVDLAKALYAGGIQLLEITFDQKDPDNLKKTPSAIRQVKEALPEMLLGAGTVLNKTQVDAAISGGALYIISPNVDEDVIRYTKEKNLLSIPGAMTPSEIAAAYKYGADVVKMFPVRNLGVSYIKDIRAPLSHIKLLATGGVDEKNFADYLNAGMIGAGISGRLTDKALISEGNFSEFTKRAEAFIKIAKENG